MYNHKQIEKKWQTYWDKNKTFKTENDFSKTKYYTLDMFPFPSGAGLHVGHPEGYTANDIIARYKHAKGYNVLHPMGWDAFGLPAENYAIKTGIHPKIVTKQNIDNFRKQIKSLGISYDWDREVDTTDPKYYRWTQWIFLKMFEHGLAYEQDLPINYCPSCKTGLANEEVLNDFSCERCGEKVEKKRIRQWVLAITKYADRLLKDVDKLDWPESIKEMQRNWIGKSEGCEFEMRLASPHSVSPKGREVAQISVYTTRIDTVFGMTYAVVAPDHKDIDKFITEEQRQACEEYIKQASQKSDQDRTADDKEKTGVFTGSYVINPFNGKEVPLWIADYVLGNYGTGAVMAVPAHDTRDFEFARKYGLEIIQSIAPKFVGLEKGKFPIKNDPNIKISKQKGVTCVIEDKENKKILLLSWKKENWTTFVGGGIEKGEKIIKAAKREIKEETGYTDLKLEKGPFEYKMKHFYPIKNINFKNTKYFLWFSLNSNKQEKIKKEESEKHIPKWYNVNKLSKLLSLDDQELLYNLFSGENNAFTEYGILVNSQEFDGLDSKTAQEKLIEYASKKGFGEKKINYKLRDWLFSRQRYWGEPIPLIHLEIPQVKQLPHITDISEATDDNKAYILKRAPKEGENTTGAICPSSGMVRELITGGKVFSKIYDGIYGKIVCDYKLPLELPEMEDFAPAGDGQSPLAKVDSFVNVKLAENLTGKRETNTMPQWGGSCWYYLRYMDPNNPNKLVDSEVEKYWGQVDSYVGGAEHAVLHLLYARFWHKFLFDIGVVSHDEPFYRLRNQGLIQSYIYVTEKGKSIHIDLVEEKNGEYFHKETGEKLEKKIGKMSKSLGNVINPDDIIEKYGADSLRLYEMYMADFKDSAPWDTKNIIGVRRFLNKVWNNFEIKDNKTFSVYDDDGVFKDDEYSLKLLNKTIKKVEEDIGNYKFNTAIASLMILIKHIPKGNYMSFRRTFLKLLNPFAPHIAEELWEQEKKLDIDYSIKYNKELKKSIHFAEWPEYDEKLVVDDTIKIAVQVLGKVRGTIEISKDEDKESVLEKAKNNEDVAKWLEGKNIVKEIYVPGKIVNLVVK